MSTSSLNILPYEILFEILHERTLTVFDRACFMVTCKRAAFLVSISNATMSMPNIGHRVEGEGMEWKTRVSCLHSGEDFVHAIRTREDHLIKFFRRLDEGWNRSETSFCSACGLFRSMSADYWDRKAELLQYKRCGRIAEFWRSRVGGHRNGVDCSEYMNKYVKKWLSERPVDYLICPECKVSPSIDLTLDSCFSQSN